MEPTKPSAYCYCEPKVSIFLILNSCGKRRTFVIGLIFASPKSRPGPRIDEDFMGCCINYEPQYSVEWHDAELDPNASPVVSGKVQTSLLEFWKSRVSVISDPNSLQDFRRSDPNVSRLCIWLEKHVGLM